MSVPKTNFPTIAPGLLNAFSGVCKRSVERLNELDRQAARLDRINGVFEKDFATIEEADAFIDMKNRECAAKSGNIKDLLNLAK